VQFFLSPDVAERAGFRACRRCEPRNSGAADRVVAEVVRACREAERNEEIVSVGRLAATLATTEFQLHRMFKRVLGIAPKQYLDACRVGRLKEELRKGDVTTALYAAGYGSSSRLYERSNQQLGMTPRTFAQGGRGTQIGYAVAPCALGHVLVAATERGVCSIQLGSNKETLAATLGQLFPEAEITPAGEELERYVKQVVEHVAGLRPHLDVPLDIVATTFQRRVWQTLQHIPYGSTRTYGEVAQKIGRPTAARAVARACATNPVALAIPCHRVVRGNGGIGGYRWGAERKRRLLQAEQLHKKEDARSAV
jgi:AraC family transcriptional regulator of adaptative response/methylated-DNA-[protein]-cysteine methyltransferase